MFRRADPAGRHRGRGVRAECTDGFFGDRWRPRSWRSVRAPCDRRRRARRARLTACSFPCVAARSAPRAVKATLGAVNIPWRRRCPGTGRCDVADDRWRGGRARPIAARSPRLPSSASQRAESAPALLRRARPRHVRERERGRRLRYIDEPMTYAPASAVAWSLRRLARSWPRTCSCRHAVLIRSEAPGPRRPTLRALPRARRAS